MRVYYSLKMQITAVVQHRVAVPRACKRRHVCRSIPCGQIYALRPHIDMQMTLCDVHIMRLSDWWQCVHMPQMIVQATKQQQAASEVIYSNIFRSITLREAILN